MGFPFDGLKSLVQSTAATIAQLVGQDIVARSISLTGTGAGIVSNAGRYTSTSTTGPAYTSNVNAGQYAYFDTNSNGGWVSGTNAATLQVAGGNTLGLSASAVTIGTGRYLSFTSFSDGSGTPGNATNSNARGKNAIAIGAATCVITNTMVSATSTVLCVLETADATATTILRCIPAAGSFTLTVNAAATAAVTFSFVVFN